MYHMNSSFFSKINGLKNLNITKENKQTNEQKEKFYDKPETFPTRFGLVTSHNKIHCLCLRTQAQSRYLCM